MNYNLIIERGLYSSVGKDKWMPYHGDDDGDHQASNHSGEQIAIHRMFSILKFSERNTLTARDF